MKNSEEFKEELRKAFDAGRDSIFVDLDRIYDIDPKINVIWHEKEFEEYYSENYKEENK